LYMGSESEGGGATGPNLGKKVTWLGKEKALYQEGKKASG